MTADLAVDLGLQHAVTVALADAIRNHLGAATARLPPARPLHFALAAAGGSRRVAHLGGDRAHDDEAARQLERRGEVRRVEVRHAGRLAGAAGWPS